jgi:hypothetical protein
MALVFLKQNLKFITYSIILAKINSKKKSLVIYVIFFNSS